MKPFVTPSTIQKLLTLQSPATPSNAKHRADPGASRRFSGAFTLGAVLVIGGSIAGGIALPAAGALATASGGHVAETEPQAAAKTNSAGDARNTIVVDSVVGAAGPVTGGSAVTIAGVGLDGVKTVQIGGAVATVVEASEDTLTVAVPAASASAVGATVDVALLDASGAALPVYTRPAGLGTDSTASEAAGTAASDVEVPSSPADASVTPRGTSAASGDGSASVPAPLAAPAPGFVSSQGVVSPKGEDGASVRAAKSAPQLAALSALPLTFEYTQDPRVTAQLGYVLTHWNNYNTGAYGVIAGNDCVNFTSQGLIARGWTMDAEWYYDAATGQSGSAWISSTAMMDYLAARPQLATALDDSQRAQLKVGDIAQFDWDNSGDRDHTATVSRIETTDSGTRVYVAGHTKDSDYWSVDEAVANSGGSVHYWSLS